MICPRHTSTSRRPERLAENPIRRFSLTWQHNASHSFYSERFWDLYLLTLLKHLLTQGKAIGITENVYATFLNDKSMIPFTCTPSCNAFQYDRGELSWDISTLLIRHAATDRPTNKKENPKFMPEVKVQLHTITLLLQIVDHEHGGCHLASKSGVVTDAAHAVIWHTK